MPYGSDIGPRPVAGNNSIAIADGRIAWIGRQDEGLRLVYVLGRDQNLIAYCKVQRGAATLCDPGGYPAAMHVPLGLALALAALLSLHARDHRFRKGHRIMVHVQSTWFPIIDRNPQTFVPNIFEAKDADYRAATHEIHRSRRFPSRIELPVVVP